MIIQQWGTILFKLTLLFLAVSWFSFVYFWCTDFSVPCHRLDGWGMSHEIGTMVRDTWEASIPASTSGWRTLLLLELFMLALCRQENNESHQSPKYWFSSPQCITKTYWQWLPFAFAFLPTSHSLFQLLQAFPATTSWAHLLCRNSMTAHQMKTMASDQQGWLTKSTFSSLTSWSSKVVRKQICVGRVRRYCILLYHFKVQMKYTILAKIGLTNYTG